MSANLWKNARRSLARLFASAEIQTISLTHVHQYPVIRYPREIGSAASDFGVLADNWKPHAAILVAPGLQAETGSREAFLMPRALVIEGLAGWGTSGCQILSKALQNVSALVMGNAKSWQLGAALSVQPVPLDMRKPTCRASRNLTANLRVALLPRILWEAKSARIQAGLTPLAQIPLTRLRLAVPETMNKALAAGKRQLSMASGTPLEDLVLLGLYPDMPIAAVKQLAVEDSGRAVRFWLKPDALTTLAKQRRVTLVIGRRRSSGQIVQMVL